MWNVSERNAVDFFKAVQPQREAEYSGVGLGRDAAAYGRVHGALAGFRAASER